MNAKTLLRVFEFEMRTASDSTDLQDIQFKFGSRCRLLGIPEMTLAEYDNAKFELREISRKKYESEKALKGGVA